MFSRAPFFRILLSLVCGIALQYFLQSVWLIAVAACVSSLCITAALIPVSAATSYKLRWLFGAGVLACCVAIGSLAFFCKDKQNTWNLSPEKEVYRCHLTDFPQEKEKTFLCKLKIESLIDDDVQISVNKGIIAYVPKDSLVSGLAPGDVILLKAAVFPPESNGNPEAFDYAFYLKQQGLSGIAFLRQGEWQLLKRPARLEAKKQALLVREKLLTVFDDLSFGRDEKAVLSALTLGYKNDLSPELKQQYASSGASHILAISGMHIGILYMITSFLLSFTGKNNRRSLILKQILIVLFLWGFAFVTGLSAPVVRAVIMFSMTAAAITLHRRTSIINTLCVSAAGMLLYNPYYLFDAGFILSYTAVLSIVLIQPYLENLITVKRRLLKPLWSLVTVSVAAQTGTFPFVVYFFHQFPNYFILTNLLIIPLTYLIVLLAVLLFAAYPFFGVVEFVAWPLGKCLELMNGSTASIEQLPFAVFNDIWLNIAELFLFLVLLIGTGFFLWKKKFIALVTSLGCVIIVLLLHLGRIYMVENQSKLIFFQQRDFPAVNVLSGKHNYLLTANLQAATFAAKSYWMKHKAEAPVLLSSPFDSKEIEYENSCMHFKHKSVLVITGNEFTEYRSEHSFPVDYMIIGKGFNSSVQSLIALFPPHQLVLDASLPTDIGNRLKNECNSLGISYYDITEKGALEIDVE
ncbi:MAG: ComEC family competence protein [Bacteroidales bacterium]|jgi:competence protein ComEC|nr:ComEC family competence protein [Bacteroidales bacterium]